MNALSLSLRVLAVIGALAAAYFWHDTGKQKAEQVVKIGSLNKELEATKGDLSSTSNKLAGAETKADNTQKQLDSEKALHNTTRDQLSTARTEIDTHKVTIQEKEAKLTESENKVKTISDEIETLNAQLAKAISQEKYAALERKLKDSIAVAKDIQDRLDEANKIKIELTKIEDVKVDAEKVRAKTVIPTNFDNVVSTKVKQVKGDQVLVDFGTDKGAILNTNVRLQDGLAFIGFGRVIFTDANQSLIQLAEDHESVPSNKEIFLLVPKPVAAVVVPALPAKK